MFERLPAVVGHIPTMQDKVEVTADSDLELAVCNSAPGKGSFPAPSFGRKTSGRAPWEKGARNQRRVHKYSMDSAKADCLLVVKCHSTGATSLAVA